MSLSHLSSVSIPVSDKPRLVIIGGGFAGMKLVNGLVREHLQIVLVDRHNYHTFQPLLYQVATAGLEPDSIAGPLRKHLEHEGEFYFRMANVKYIDPDNDLIATDIGTIGYDYLVIATGSRTNYFNNDSIVKHAFPLKQIPQALNLRSHILQNFEQAVIEQDPIEKQRLMNVVIAGGGPTGVEVAGAFGELKNTVLPKDYPELDFTQMKIYLIEGTGRVLNGMSDASGEKALRYLKRFDVEVKLGKLIENVDAQQVTMNDGESIQTKTIIWAAGVKGNVPNGFKESSIERHRLLVDRYNQVLGYKDVFALGDVALMKTDEFPNGHPMQAPVAMQQGGNLAANITKRLHGKSMKPFKYKDKGSMATIGRNKAVVDLPGNLHFGGFLAWLVWMFIHLFSIIGLRNKLVIFNNWVWNYFTYDKGTRLIIRPYKRKMTKDIFKKG